MNLERAKWIYIYMMNVILKRCDFVYEYDTGISLGLRLFFFVEYFMNRCNVFVESGFLF